MQEFRIFTEGSADEKFIKGYISEHFQINLSKEYFDKLEGWTGYKAGGVIHPNIKLAQDDKKKIILILDADDNFENRRKEVLTDFEKFGIQINLFLFPNDSQSGDLEILLSELAIDRKVIECFNQYENCIQGYELPVSKARIFAYLDALLPSKNKKSDRHDLFQPANRDYRNTAHWDLHHAYLNPLKDFLQPFFK